MDTKNIAIGLVIGLIIGAGMGYLVASDSSNVSNLETQIAELQSSLTARAHQGVSD